jgi:hypothetical protein
MTFTRFASWGSASIMSSPPAGIKSKTADVGLILRKTNVKRSRFDLTLFADDISIDKKGKTVNEPVVFYVAGSKRPYELVFEQGIFQSKNWLRQHPHV